MLHVAIVAGGDSGEYEISIASGKQVENNIDRSRFLPYLIEIREDKWICRQENSILDIDKNDFSIRMGDRKITFDVVFNAIHGTPGENGRLQGYFDMLKIPYTSCGVLTSSLTFNKAYCKEIVRAQGVQTARSVHLFIRDLEKAMEQTTSLSLPCFIKPNNGGSSVGMSKVHERAGLPEAFDKAFREDDEVLVEEFIPGRELTCGVLRTEGRIVAFPVTEVISENDFFDYEAKYTTGLAREVVPADIPDSVSEECTSISVALYNALNCKGVVRFDYIHNDRGFWFLEVNTVPGLSEASIVPKMARAYGWSFTELVTRLIEETLNSR